MTDRTSPDGATRVLEIFEEGRRFTEDLLRENERLRALNAQLKTEKREIEGQYVKVDVPTMQRRIGMLEEDVRTLRTENQELKSQYTSVEEENREFADRYLNVERQNSDLANLYVASQRLHSTLDYDGVIQIIKEIVINMVGSETFGIYAVDDTGQRLDLVGEEGLGPRATEAVRLGEGALGQCAQSGEAYVERLGGDVHGLRQDPIATIPLKTDDRLIGVIGIYQLLPQKSGFYDVDFDLFELLGQHAAKAMHVARLCAAAEDRRTAPTCTAGPATTTS
jgi:nitrate/nitrite-specific signal transduction histidine kinase